MLPNPNNNQTLYIAIAFACVALYVVLAWGLWHYAFTGKIL